MDARERWQRVSAILEAALEIPADRRAAFLSEACAGDAELHAELVGLLAAHARSGRFLDRSALALVGDTSAPTAPVARSGDAPRFAPGQTVGRYRIQHLVGAGGMGEVYAADELEHGRRVALKVMKGHLPSAEGRDRFLYEGRLASAVNHPNSVYVFGSEIIDGQPVIVMELVERGTLKDLVQSAGPLPPAEAVDAILQVIAGAEAAHAGGILHRDIKPGNCFVDRDGTVKVGDFGVSVATGAELTRYAPASAIQVTPQYAPPERLRGSAPDVRADIYAVGATLFYLLTGRAPFDGTDLLVLLTRVQTDMPRSPRAFVPSVPRGLAAVVLRCLAKNPAARYPTYAGLRAALSPFRSGDPQAAPLAARVAAGLVDQVVMLLFTSALGLLVLAIRGAPAPGRSWSLLRYGLSWAGYYLATEGLGAASLGKRAFSLCVADEEGGRPRFGQVAIRTAIFVFATILPSLASVDVWARMLGLSDMSPFDERAMLLTRLMVLASASGHLVPLTLFVTARRSNRWAGLHERLSGTRVVRIVADHDAPVPTEAARPSEAMAGSTASGRRGPFVLSGVISVAPDATLWQAFDPVLRRDVWVRDVAAGASISPLERRRLARPGRARWLGGQSEGESWEAFEAPRGLPFRAAAAARPPWIAVRQWLADLAAELAAAEECADVTAFTLDHVWITAAGRAMLLDFPAPGTVPGARPSGEALQNRAQQLLSDVAQMALAGTTKPASGHQRIPAPLPPAGTVLLRALRDPVGLRAADLHRLSRQAMEGATTIPRWSRLVPGVAILIPIALIAIGGAGMSRGVGQSLLVGVGSQDVALFNALVAVDALDRSGVPPSAPRRSALEVYVARRYEGLAARAASFSGFLVPYQALGEDIARRHAVNVPGELESAVALIGRDNLDALNDAPRLPVPSPLLVPPLAMPFVAAVGLASVLLAIVLRGGLLLTVLGLVVVDTAGERVTRIRAGARALAAWAPVFALVPMRDRVVRAALAGDVDGWVAAGLFLVTLIAAAGLLAVMRPARGIHERVTGTWITPA